MKAMLFFLITVSLSSSLAAKEINSTVDEVITPMTDNFAHNNCPQDMRVLYLTKRIDQQQKAYEDKINFLETELQKIRGRLVEKSINQEKNEVSMIERYNVEVISLKKELAYKTKSLLEHQRQMEKMKPSEDLKDMIKYNTELSSKLRRSEDQIANMKMNPDDGLSGARLPASIKDENK